ncbi:protein of unknown function [Thermococcus camini]|uniref:Uncharacterized protein n=2 Tax=Thermococcus camini TaxID=2016373 RepID=A0A7G2DB99_9EURY|nr:protein of unknown function [Thermococcus camini]
MDKRLVTVVLLAILLISAAIFHIDTGGLKPTWVTVELKDAKDAFIFIKVLYPDGFRGIYSGRVKWDTIMLNLRDVKMAWEAQHPEEHGTTSLLMITLVKNGSASFHTFTVDWSKLPARIVITPRYRTVTLESGETGIYQSRVALEERNVSVPFVQVIVAGESYGIVDIGEIPASMAFRVYLFDGLNWSSIGHTYPGVGNGMVCNPMLEPNSTLFIERYVTYRYERWKISLDGQFFYEEYIYVPRMSRGFHHGWAYDVEKTTTPPGVKLELVGQFKLSQNPLLRYYDITEEVDRLGLELLPFLEELASEGVVSRTALESARDMNLMMILESPSNKPPLWFSITVFGRGGREYSVFRGHVSTGILNGEDVEVLVFCFAENGVVNGTQTSGNGWDGVCPS